MPTETRTHDNDSAGGDLSDALRANLLELVYTQFGERLAEMVSRALSNSSVTAREVQAILRAAAKMSTARNAAFASAGLKLTDFIWAERARPRATDSRNASLLAYCVKVTAGKRRRGELLHDRVRMYLESRSQWPILNAIEFEVRAKPAALVLDAFAGGDAH